MIEKIKKIYPIFLIWMFLLFFGTGQVLAYVMSSTDYRIQYDSVNFGGGLGTSTDYVLQDTYGEISSGISTSTSYGLGTGFEQSGESFLAMSASTDTVVLSPDIGGISGGFASNTAYWIVTTDNPGGYSLIIEASSSPALECTGGGCSAYSDSFVDYTPSTPDTADFDWLIFAADSEFGFTPEGADIVQKFKDDTGACGTGSSDTPEKCWYGLATTTEAIAGSIGPNTPDGASTIIRFQAESGGSHIQPVGNYNAMIIVTAMVN